MSHNNKVHSHGNVPFSWEKKPGISKATSQLRTKFHDMEDDDRDHDDHQGFVIKLPPPPCPLDRPRISVHGAFQVPPPPGSTFDRPHTLMLLRSSSAKGLRNKLRDEGPFLAAFKECTKSGVNINNKPAHNNRSYTNFMSGLRNFFAVEPCKSFGSCAVCDGNLVRASHRLAYNYGTERYGRRY